MTNRRNQITREQNRPNRTAEQEVASKGSGENQARGPSTKREPALGRQMNPFDDFSTYFRDYARERPETVALTCLGVGFILGWKMKLW